MSFSEWLNTKEGIKWRNEQSKKMRINNPMFNKKISEKSTKNKNYQKIGEKISKTRIKRIKEGKIKVSHSKDTRLKMGKSKLNNKNPMWKGEVVGITSSLHQWIKNHKPKPKFCEICKKNKPYDLANISGKYKRDINDFEWLCRKCHMKKDGRYYKWQWHKRRSLK